MTRDEAGQALAARIRAFVDASVTGAAHEPADTLAVDIFAYQRARDAVARALAPEPVTSVHDIPAVPVALFKQLAVGTVAAQDAGAVYRTSGTTRTGRGVHAMAAPDLYEHNAIVWARHCLGPFPTEVVGLLSDPSHVPDASLSHMVAAFHDAGAGDCTWHVHDGQLDRYGLDQRIAALGAPAFIGATAFALAEWLDGDVPRPPAGSVLMVTGGFKGRIHKLDGSELLTVAAERLGCRVVTEYGMTELSSQLWGEPDGPFAPPPWLVATAVDPLTGEGVPTGTPGQLRFLDLCNLDAAVHIETLDQGIVHGDGRVTLFGRLPGAPARGCSLTIEEAWEAR